MARDATSLLRYNPNEPRDWRGRWGAGGSPAGNAAAAYLKSLTGKLAPRTLNDYDAADYQRTRLDPLRNDWSLDQWQAVQEYQDHSFTTNETARRHLEAERPADAKRADLISSAMRP